MQLHRSQHQNIFIQVGAGAGDLDARALFRDGFTEYIKREVRVDEISKIALVEPNPVNLAPHISCWKDYPMVEVFNYAISLKTNAGRVLPFYIEKRDAPHYQVASTELNHVLKHYPPPHQIEIINVNTVSLEQLVAHVAGDKEVALLALDIEGIDGQVIMDTDFSRLNVRNLSVETLHLGAMLPAVYAHLHAYGYVDSGTGIDHSGIFDRMFSKTD